MNRKRTVSLKSGILFLLMAVSLVVGSCKTKDKEPLVVSVTGVTVTPTEKELVIGDKFTITAEVKPANASNKKVTWSSSASTIASVTKEGVVTAIKEGDATITATTADGGKTATCQVKVKKPIVSVTGVTVTPTEKELVIGEKFTITAEVQPADASNKQVRWSSSSPTIATVTDAGDVTALKEGETTITATTVDGGKTATCQVKVKKPVVLVTGVTVTPTKKELEIGDKFTITAEVQPADASNKQVRWSSSASTIATVTDAGEVTALKEGEATITATTADGGKTATCQVKVKKPIVSVTGVTVTPTKKELVIGEKFTITAEVQPADASNKQVRWSSLSPTIATVTDAGEVTALNEGEVTITATTVDGDKTATCRVTVKKPVVLVTGVTVTPTEKELEIGGKFTITAEVQPADASDKQVRWSSSSPTIATVTDAGEVTALNEGEVTITATTVDGGKTATCRVIVKSSVPDERPHIRLTTEKVVGEKITFLIDAYMKERANVWIDLNNNGTKDSGESVTTFQNPQEYTLGAQTIKVYGRVNYLDCQKQSIVFLDVSKNTALTGLYCHENKLSTLDVTKNTSLTDLNCRYNELTVLDVTKNTALKSLDCSYNKLTVLDVTKNTALKSLDCSYNKLTVLDVTKNSALEDLTISRTLLNDVDLSKNTALHSLNWTGCPRTTLDLSGTKLTELYCNYGKSLTSLKIPSTLNDFLVCGYCKLSAEALNAIFEALPDVTKQTEGRKTILIYENPGTGTCNTKIATDKGWNVQTTE